jgi:type IV secretory pathway TraG/TraD family ATPase VirD4
LCRFCASSEVRFGSAAGAVRDLGAGDRLARGRRPAAHSGHTPPAPACDHPTEIQDQAQLHAATQGREYPALIARRWAGQPPGVPLVRVGRQLLGVPYGADLGHIAVIAPTRSGKGLHLTQTLLTWPGAAVVVDPKGEQWQRTASWRASNIGPVYCLPSAGIDLLDYFSLGDPLDTQELHQHLIHPWQDKDPVFAEKCLALFTAAAQVGAATDSHALRVLAGWADQRAPIALQAATRTREQRSIASWTAATRDGQIALR